jgi:hypothetical protein
MLGTPMVGEATMNTIKVGSRKVLALGIACALLLPFTAAHAQSSTKKPTVREQKLEQRVNQLEQELAELKQMIQEQKADTAQATATAQAAQTQAQATETKVAKVAATPPPKPVFSSAPGVSVALHGFINASAFSQDKGFTYGNGQNAEFPIPGSAGHVNDSLTGVDVRNTRFWLDFTGAKFGGDWIGGGRIEMDFFGGFNGTGAYAQSQPTPRLRQAYMDITNPTTGSTFRIGQQWDLLFPLDMTPQSLSHIAFPLGYGTGFTGWRFSGISWMKELNHGSDGPIWRLDLGAYGGTWSTPGSTNNYTTAGNVGFNPQYEARLHVQDKTWLAFVAAHYSKVDLRGVDGASPTPIKSNIKSTAIQAGAQWMPGNWVFKALAYAGNGIGEVFGDLSQFGDIADKGGYAQVGYKFTPNWSVYGFYSQSKPDTDDVVKWLSRGSTGLLKNRQSALSLQYTAGPYDLSLEWIHAKLDSTTNGTTRQTTQGNEITLNGNYKF